MIIIARSLLGLLFVVFGLNGFLQFIPAPPQPEGPAKDFSTALFVSHYFYVIAALQVIGGALLLIGRYVPLGLMLLGPVIVNIILFHIFLEPKGLAMALVIGVMAVFLLWAYRQAFSGLIKPWKLSDVIARAGSSGLPGPRAVDRQDNH